MDALKRSLACIVVIGGVVLCYTLLKAMLGDASLAAERVRLANEAFKVIQFTESNRDLPRNGNGRFDPSLVVSSPMALESLTFNASPSLEAILEKSDSEVLATF